MGTRLAPKAWDFDHRCLWRRMAWDAYRSSRRVTKRRPTAPAARRLGLPAGRRSPLSMARSTFRPDGRDKRGHSSRRLSSGLKRAGSQAPGVRRLRSHALRWPGSASGRASPIPGTLAGPNAFMATTSSRRDDGRRAQSIAGQAAQQLLVASRVLLQPLRHEGISNGNRKWTVQHA
jgi:hypothetical protein